MLALSSPTCSVLRPSFYHNPSARSGRNCLLFPHVLQDYGWSPDTHFYPETKRLMSWPNDERFSCSLQSPVVSLLLISYQWRRTFSPQFFVISFSKGTCSPSSHLLCPISSSLQRTKLSGKLSLGLVESRILYAAPADTHLRTPLIAFFSVQLRTPYDACFLATLCLSMTSGPGPGEFSGFLGSIAFLHSPSFGRG